MECLRLLGKNKIQEAVAAMPCGEWMGLRFQSEPKNTEDGFAFVKYEVINICRDAENEYSYDRGYSKSYRSGLEAEDVQSLLQDYSGSGWKLKEYRLERY